jgi:uncharacterized protein (TIGR00255 family)
MLKSMTGYGRSEKSFKEKTFSVEIKTLNSKQTDINLKLPYNYKDLESSLRNIIKDEVKRGKVDVYINLENNEQGVANINTELAKKYINQLKNLAESEGLAKENILEIVLKMPEVISSEKNEIEEEEKETITKCLEEALISLNEFRTQEGDVLENELRTRINIILSSLKDIEVFEPKRNETFKTKLWAKLDELQKVKEIDIDKNRFEQELIYYTEKIDITEEKVRLKTHCEYFLSTMINDPEPGKKLGFISQEIGREINTLGSKANDADMQKIVVLMKDELEKIKEQSLNIL